MKTDSFKYDNSIQTFGGKLYACCVEIVFITLDHAQAQILKHNRLCNKLVQCTLAS